MGLDLEAACPGQERRMLAVVELCEHTTVVGGRGFIAALDRAIVSRDDLLAE
jgi:hypothetical protein